MLSVDKDKNTSVSTFRDILYAFLDVLILLLRKTVQLMSQAK